MESASNSSRHQSTVYPCLKNNEIKSMQEHINIALTDDVISFKMALPFKSGLPYLFNHETKYLVCNLTHQRFSNLFLSTQKQKTAQKFNDRYKAIFLSSDSIPTQYIKNIINDINRINFPKNSVVDVLINPDVFDNVNECNLTSWVKKINTTASNKQIFVNLLVFGDKVIKQTLSQALANSSVIKSLSIIKALDENNLSQEIIFAHSETGVIVNQTQKHTLLNDSYQTNIMEDKNKNKVERTVTAIADQIYTTKDLFGHGEFAPDFFQVFEKLEDIYTEIPKNIDSTIILPCRKYTDIKKLADLAYQLKKNYSSESKFIIREMTQCIRYSDEQFLLHSGVNLVVPINIPFSRVLGQIAAIQNHVFNLQLPTNIESLIDLRSQFNFQGYYPFKKFSSFTLDAIAEQKKQDIEYALIRLDAFSNIPMHECVKYCQIKRSGDIYTISSNAIYIFLSAVRPNDIEIALNSVFGLNVLEFFLGYEIFDNSVLVHDELRIMAEKTEFIPSNDTGQDDLPPPLVKETSEPFLFARKSNFIRSNKVGS